jgi:hypothetical protein
MKMKNEGNALAKGLDAIFSTGCRRCRPRRGEGGRRRHAGLRWLRESDGRRDSGYHRPGRMGAEEGGRFGRRAVRVFGAGRASTAIPGDGVGPDADDLRRLRRQGESGVTIGRAIQLTYAGRRAHHEPQRDVRLWHAASCICCG